YGGRAATGAGGHRESGRKLRGHLRKRICRLQHGRAGGGAGRDGRHPNVHDAQKPRRQRLFHIRNRCKAADGRWARDAGRLPRSRLRRRKRRLGLRSDDMTTDFDAIVIGSGISGGWAAKELTEKGLKTLVLERGREIEHIRDYQGEHQPSWRYEFRNYGDRKVYERDYPIQSSFGWFEEQNRQFWNNDRLNPYVVDEKKPFHWVRGDILGGRSVLWGRQCYRWSDLDFEANARDGHGIDWPIRYKDIAPWYSYVEKFAGISGQAEGLPQLPDGEFLKPMPMNSVEQHVKAAIEKNFPGRMMTIGRVAVLTEPHNGRGACHYCGPCSRGCSVSAYFCSLTSTLPAAKATGRLTIRADSVV